jgi:D-beta-D-heptose 7-phosphate kinase/D-beta-D-heptose 1-phosphate adenosyltransferase
MEEGRWHDLLARFDEKRILVVGDVMLDHTATGQARRISPEAPVPVLSIEREVYQLGGAGNVARNVAALGAGVCLAGVVGGDGAGERVRARCREQAIEDGGLLTVAGRPTSTKTRFVAGTQQVLRIDNESDEALPADAEAQLVAGVERCAEIDAIIVSDYAKGVVSDALIAAATAAARRLDVPCVVDPKGARFARYAGCSAITPNAEEAAAAASRPARTEAECHAVAQLLADMVGCEAVVITRGRLGVSVATSGAIWHLPSRARDVFDVTGAGDTLVATLTLAAASGLRWLEAVGLGNIAAGLVVQERGAAVTTRQALLDALLADDGSGPNVLARRMMGSAA